MDKQESNHLTELDTLQESTSIKKDVDYLYGVNCIPPLYLTVIMGFQHFLMMFVSMISVPLLLSPAMCIPPDSPDNGHIIATTTFVCGLSTFIQSTFGTRLPIVQGTTFSLMVPTLILLNQPQWKCKDAVDLNVGNNNLTTVYGNLTLGDQEEYWQIRMREVQGALCVGCLFEVFLGMSGAVGYFLPYATPLTIAPVIILIGLSIVEEISNLCSEQWGIAFLTIFLVALFSQYLSEVTLPVPIYKKKKITFLKYPFFKLFSVLIAIFVVWAFCAILTVTNAFGESHPSRTDRNLRALTESSWIRIPYPGQWGWPTVSLGPVLGIMTGIIASTLESIGDYYACAKICNIPAPPRHAVNRGIAMEGIGCILSGLWGSGNGVTSFSTNFALMSITKVASRRIIQACAVFLMIFGIFPKFASLFVIIPNPIIGGLFCVLCGLTVAIGISHLKPVSLDSSRNLFILGTSLLLGLILPRWLTTHGSNISTGNAIFDQFVTVLLSTNMFVGGFIGFILDNTIPGSLEERGVLQWRQRLLGKGEDKSLRHLTYDSIPYLPKLMNKIHFLNRLPICLDSRDLGEETDSTIQ